MALAHFAWCALIALRTAQQDGQALSPLSIHAFLLRWLTVAYKQKRFPRAIASDIESLVVIFSYLFLTGIDRFYYSIEQGQPCLTLPFSPKSLKRVLI